MGVTLGDLTGNGLADVHLGISGGGIVYYANDGQTFRPRASSNQVGYLTGPGPKGVMWLRPTVGDLNGNGHLDVFAAGCCGRESSLRPGWRDEAPGDLYDPASFQPANGLEPTETGHLLPYTLVWLNQGNGRLVSNGQIIGQMGSNAVAPADLNGNGALDAFLANGRTLDAAGNYHTNTSNTVWFNHGTGQFNDSGQRLGGVESTAVAVGDLNGNGFVDAVVGNRTAG
jgi:hypothetical protein